MIGTSPAAAIRAAISSSCPMIASIPPTSVLRVRQALVHLEERDDVALFPELAPSRGPVDRPGHRLLEQDGHDRPRPVAGRPGHDARAHGVDQVAHLIIARMAACLDPTAVS